jgi:hypothetical protein
LSFALFLEKVIGYLYKTREHLILFEKNAKIWRKLYDGGYSSNFQAKKWKNTNLLISMKFCFPEVDVLKRLQSKFEPNMQRNKAV